MASKTVKTAPACLLAALLTACDFAPSPTLWVCTEHRTRAEMRTVPYIHVRNVTRCVSGYSVRNPEYDTWAARHGK